MGIRLKLIKAQIHKALTYFPQVLLGIIIMAGLFFLLFSYATKVLSEEKSAVTIKVALVIEEDSMSTDWAVGLVNSMDSIKDHFDFINMTDSEADEALVRGDVIAKLFIPESAIAGILNGSNIHCVITMSDKDPLSAILFEELARSGSITLSAAQAGIYTVSDIFINQGLSKDERETAYNDVDAFNLSYALSRNLLFRKRNASATKGLSLVSYYLSSGILFILLMSGTGLLLFYRTGKDALMYKCLSAGIGSFTEFVSGYLSVFIYQFFLLMILMAGFYAYLKGFTSWAGSQISPVMLTLFLNMLLLTVVTSAFLTMLLTIFPATSYAAMFMFLIIVVLMLLSGAFIPSAFLPETIRRIGNILPTTNMMSIAQSSLSLCDAGDSLSSFHIMNSNSYFSLLYALFFGAVSVLVIKVRRCRK